MLGCEELEERGNGVGWGAMEGWGIRLAGQKMTRMERIGTAGRKQRGRGGGPRMLVG